jgi:uncharacterized protein YeaO (DUF488 family)
MEHVHERPTIRIKRIYEPPSPDDGARILVDRLWPRGLTKGRAAIDEWMKEVAPSPQLRDWFGHKPERFAEFVRAYKRELAEDPARIALVARLRDMASRHNVTLLYAAKDPACNHAAVLLQHIGALTEPEDET